MTLTDTEYYERNRLWEDVEKKTYWPISPFHDGNCGLHAFACALIDMIITGRLSLDAEKFNTFKTTIIECIIKNFNEEHQYINVFFPNCTFVKTLAKPNLTFAYFKEILKIQTREGLAAINLVLAQSLRFIGVERYLSLINKKDGTLLDEDIDLLNDGKWIGQEVLISLADYFGIPVRLIHDRCSDDRPSDYQYYLPEGAPEFSLLNQNSHWHYLLPENQTDGLAKMLPERKKSQTSLQSNEQLLQTIEKNYIKITPIFNKATLNSLSEKLKQIFYHLKITFSTVSIGIDARNTAFWQANKAAKKSTEVLNTLRQTWNYDTNELDKQLNKLGLRKIEKDLIKGPIITDNSKDAAMAAILQNAEIAAFFSRNYTALTSFTNVTSTLPPKSYQSHTKPSLVCH